MSAEARSVTGRAQPTEEVVEIAEHLLIRVGGVGDSAAEKSCVALIAAGANALVSLGCAAGLAPACRPGSLIVPAELVSPQGEIFAVDPGWRAALLAGIQEFNPVIGTLAGVDEIIGCSEKHALLTRTGAVAADMESIAVARNARRRGLPMIAVRAISDGPEDALPMSVRSAVDAFGRARYGALLGTLVRRPGDVAALVRLRAGFNSACSTLSQVIEQTGPSLCCPWDNDR